MRLGVTPASELLCGRTTSCDADAGTDGPSRCAEDMRACENHCEMNYG